MKRTVLLVCVLALLALAPALAQRYRTAAGVRVGKNEVGLTIQQKIFERTTLEGLATAAPREVLATVLAEQHFNILGKRLNYYMGAGAHGGKLKDYGAVYGFDVIAGLEYKINGLPFLLSADLKPAFHLRHEEWFNLGSAFSIRYVIVKEPTESPLDFIKGIFSPSGKSKKRD